MLSKYQKAFLIKVFDPDGKRYQLWLWLVYGLFANFTWTVFKLVFLAQHLNVRNSTVTPIIMQTNCWKKKKNKQKQCKTQLM